MDALPVRMSEYHAAAAIAAMRPVPMLIPISIESIRRFYDTIFIIILMLDDVVISIGRE